MAATPAVTQPTDTDGDGWQVPTNENYKTISIRAPAKAAETGWRPPLRSPRVGGQAPQGSRRGVEADGQRFLYIGRPDPGDHDVPIWLITMDRNAHARHATSEPPPRAASIACGSLSENALSRSRRLWPVQRDSPASGRHRPDAGRRPLQRAVIPPIVHPSSSYLAGSRHVACGYSSPTTPRMVSQQRPPQIRPRDIEPLVAVPRSSATRIQGVNRSRETS